MAQWRGTGFWVVRLRWGPQRKLHWAWPLALMSQPLRALVSSSPPLFLYDFSNPLETELMISLKIHRCLRVKSGPLICDCFMKSLSQNEFQYSLGQNTGVGSCSLLQGIFPIQGSNLGLPHCRWVFFLFFFFYQLSHQGSPRILEWVVYPFSRGSSQPRNWTRVSCIAGRFFTSWATRKAK